MIKAYKNFWTNYTNFNGRASVSDYWWVVLCNVIISIVLSAFGFIVLLILHLLFDKYYVLVLYIVSILLALYSLATIIPNISLSVRRLHDINKSGFFYFFNFLPIAGPIIFLVCMCTRSIDKDNKYGK